LSCTPLSSVVAPAETWLYSAIGTDRPLMVGLAGRWQWACKGRNLPVAIPQHVARSAYPTTDLIGRTEQTYLWLGSSVRSKLRTKAVALYDERIAKKGATVGPSFFAFSLTITMTRSF